ncbi:hypothetical protein Aduo_010013 [Ancylostoma duodenale]
MRTSRLEARTNRTQQSLLTRRHTRSRLDADAETRTRTRDPRPIRPAASPRCGPLLLLLRAPREWNSVCLTRDQHPEMINNQQLNDTSSTKGRAAGSRGLAGVWEFEQMVRAAGCWGLCTILLRLCAPSPDVSRRTLTELDGKKLAIDQF